MKKSWFICILLILLSPFLAFSQDNEETSQVQKARIIVDKANIYLESNPYSIVIDTVGRETVVSLFQTGQKNKKWLYISYYSKKRMAQVTGFIDVNLVEIIREEPERPEPPEEVEEKTEEKIMEEERVHAEKAESADLEKEPIALKKQLIEIEKKTEVKTAAEVNTAEMEQAKEEAERIESIGEKADAAAQEEKETTEPVKQLIKKIQEEKESVSEGQKIEKTEEQEIAAESQIMIEKKEGAKEKLETEEKGKEALPELEKQDEETRMQMEKEIKKEETESHEEQKEEPKGEGSHEVLTKISVKVRMANIRLMPSLKSAVIHQLPFGVELKPLAKSGNWYRVNLPPNPEGIILSGYIHDSIVDETFEKIVLTPPEPEDIPEDDNKGLEEEPEPIKEIPRLVRTESPGLPIWIGAGSGYTMPSETSFGNGINFGLTLGYWITKYLAVELRVPYFQSDVTGSIERLNTGQFKSLSLTMSVQARYTIKDHIIPYAVGGGDYHLNKFNLDKQVVNSWKSLGFDIEENVDPTFGFHFGGGLDYFFFRNLALNLDVRYYTASLKGNRQLVNIISQEEALGTIDNIKLNSLQACISVKFFLNR